MISMVKTLKVSKSTDPKKLAGTIKHYLSTGRTCELLALGSHAICVSVKSLAQLKSMFGICYLSNIEYFTCDKDGTKVSGIRFVVWLEKM